MQINEFSIWGCALVLLLLAGALALLWLVDRSLLRKSLRVNLLKPFPRLPGKMWLSALAGMLLGGIAMVGCLVLYLPCRLFLPILVVVFLCLLLSVPRSVQTYYRSLIHTQEHRRYLLANGATHLESVIPSVRRALRTSFCTVSWTRTSPMPFATLMMFCGMLMGGATLTAALAAVVVLWAAIVATSILSSVLAMWIADRWLFDKQENLTTTKQ